MSFLDILISLEAMGLGFCVCIGVAIAIVESLNIRGLWILFYLCFIILLLIQYSH